jgi:hypothetical protein
VYQSTCDYDYSTKALRLQQSTHLQQRWPRAM